MGSHRHRVDDQFASVVEVEHNHLEHVAGAIGSEDESSQWRLVVAHVGDHERIRDGVLDIVGLHTVFARRAVKLHTDESYYTTSVSATLVATGLIPTLTPCPRRTLVVDISDPQHHRAIGVKQDQGGRLSEGVAPSQDSCTPVGESFEAFVESIGLRLSRAFVARYGVELGAEAFADALEWAWEHRDDLAAMENSVGYLYRVGQTSVRSNVRRRHRAVLPVEESGYAMPEPNPGLHVALAHLTDDQRVAVLLVHAHGYSYAEAASLLGISVSTLRNHIHRGMNRLRKHLEH